MGTSERAVLSPDEWRNQCHAASLRYWGGLGDLLKGGTDFWPRHARYWHGQMLEDIAHPRRIPAVEELEGDNFGHFYRQFSGGAAPSIRYLTNTLDWAAGKQQDRFSEDQGFYYTLAECFPFVEMTFLDLEHVLGGKGGLGIPLYGLSVKGLEPLLAQSHVPMALFRNIWQRHLRTVPKAMDVTAFQTMHVNAQQEMQASKAAETYRPLYEAILTAWQYPQEHWYEPDRPT